MSTNKVYGDAPNEIPMKELEKRFDYSNPEDFDGVKETFRIDHSTHSIFGASKVSADIMVQEYGRYFGMKTTVLRGGCLTGPSHSGVELHGFLSYLVKCGVSGKEYKIFGYKGKQVRDNIHSYDVIKAMECIINNPRKGEVYNIGGGRENSISMLEAIEKIERITGNKMNYTYDKSNRIGDHICYITDLSKFKNDYPEWKITKSIDRILLEIVGSNQKGTTERYIPGDGGDSYFEAYAKDIEKFPFGEVLDIGCGQGHLTYRISLNPLVTSVKGTDLYEGFQMGGPKVSYEKIDTIDLISDISHKYDTICSTEHIEHLSEETQIRLLKWVGKSLKPNGLFIGSMPFPDDPNNPNPYHLRTISMESWKSILEEHFREIEIWDCGHNVYSWTAKL